VKAAVSATWSPAADATAWITLNRESTRNALDWEMLRDIHTALDEIEAARDLRVVIIRSALENVFIAGGDIAVMRDLDLSEGTRFVYAGQRLMRRLEESPNIVIAAVGGFALGGGFELSLACDLVVASERAVFGLPETQLGLIPGWGGTQRLVRTVSPQRARELVFTGRRLKASEALAFGLVNSVVAPDDLERRSLELAADVVAGSPTAIQHAKRALVQGARTSLDQGLVIEAESWLANLASPDRVEGLAAFLEKRPPNYRSD
jgi:enoyl-CoA hydratase/carnithine racemase